MGNRLKVLLAFVLCFGLMAGVSLILLQHSMRKSYEAIERDDIADNMGRVEQRFEASATSLKNLATDWAVWNEMYRYALKPDARWAKDNIGPESLAPADIVFSAVFGKDGRLLTYSAIQIDGAYLNVPVHLYIGTKSSKKTCC
ncbi:MAG TPA: CHASE4 domain-containing protein [Rhodoferax sp.]